MSLKLMTEPQRLRLQARTGRDDISEKLEQLVVEQQRTNALLAAILLPVQAINTCVAHPHLACLADTLAHRSCRYISLDRTLLIDR